MGRNIVDIASGEILLETEHQAEWLGDGTGYYVRSADPDTISAYDLNGNLRFSNGRRFAIVSQTGKWLAGGGNTEQSDSGKIFLLMNTDNGQKVDLCALVKDTAFSPDDKHAIVQTIHDNRGHIWMVDLESWEATPIDVYFDVDSFFVGWWDV
ncbi:MAG: hypothetical protein MUF38_16470 [Anaerolineae bacterium]|nr:hypothetical protein [Anaerolineae bacterium]